MHFYYTLVHFGQENHVLIKKPHKAVIIVIIKRYWQALNRVIYEDLTDTTTKGLITTWKAINLGVGQTLIFGSQIILNKHPNILWH